MEQPSLPIAISFVGGKYLLFSVDAFSFLRREHRICGMLIGTIPQSPSQNVFLGLPVQLMPEEVRVLVTKGIAYVVDDQQAHELALKQNNTQRLSDYMASIGEASRQASSSQLEKQQQRRQKSLQKQNLQPSSSPPADDDNTPTSPTTTESLFETTSTRNPTPTNLKPLEPQPFGITPATSTSLLPVPPSTTPPSSAPIKTPKSYHLFAHLHSKGYYLSPGLRFGCQYTVYPGDPLRFHSHFLATHVGWDEEMDLMDIVGGGRLGTGVKKGYLIGGLDPNAKKEDGVVGEEGGVRTFSIEWAGM